MRSRVSRLFLLVLGLSGWLACRDASANHIPYAFGDVFAGVGSGLIKHFDGAGNLLETLDTGTGCNEDLGMSFTATGHLLATAAFGSCGSGHVVEFDSQGGLIGPFGSGYGFSTESITIDGSGNVYVGEPDSAGQLPKFDSTGAPIHTFTLPTEDRGTDWIDLAADQCTLYYTSEGRSILRYDLCTDSALAAFTTGLHGAAYALRIVPGSGGNVLVADTSDIHLLDSGGAIIGTWMVPAETSFFFALNLDPDGQHFWSAGYSSGNVYKFDMTTSGSAPVLSFNAGIVSSAVSGLAVFGERVSGRETQCTDGVDNDDDNLVDCADPDCALDPACGTTTTTSTVTTTSSTSTTTTLPRCGDFPCGRNGKVSLCHLPPGNPANANTLCISQNAVPAHLANHGDYCGPCR